MWKDSAEHCFKYGDKEIRDGLELLQTTKEGKAKFSYLPVVELLLIVGQQLVGITLEGAFTSGAPRELLETFATAPDEDDAIVGEFQNESLMGGASKCWDPRSDPGDCGKIFVDGITGGTTVAMLSEHFGKYGEIKDVAIMVDKYTGKRRGYSFIVFESANAVDSVLADLASHTFDGKTLDVKRLHPPAGSKLLEGAPWRGTPKATAVDTAPPASDAISTPPAPAAMDQQLSTADAIDMELERLRAEVKEQVAALDDSNEAAAAAGEKRSFATAFGDGSN